MFVFPFRSVLGGHDQETKRCRQGQRATLTVPRPPGLLSSRQAFLHTLRALSTQQGVKLHSTGKSERGQQREVSSRPEQSKSQTQGKRAAVVQGVSDTLTTGVNVWPGKGGVGVARVYNKPRWPVWLHANGQEEE